MVHGNKRVRIEPRHMGHLLRQLADFRNICAHEERLYCARLGKSRDILVSDLVPMMQKLLPPRNFENMVSQLIGSVEDATPQLSTINIEQVLQLMGFQSIDEISALSAR